MDRPRGSRPYSKLHGRKCKKISKFVTGHGEELSSAFVELINLTLNIVKKSLVAVRDDKNIISLWDKRGRPAAPPLSVPPLSAVPFQVAFGPVDATATHSEHTDSDHVDAATATELNNAPPLSAAPLQIGFGPIDATATDSMHHTDAYHDVDAAAATAENNEANNSAINGDATNTDPICDNDAAVTTDLIHDNEDAGATNTEVNAAATYTEVSAAANNTDSVHDNEDNENATATDGDPTLGNTATPLPDPILSPPEFFLLGAIHEPLLHFPVSQFALQRDLDSAKNSLTLAQQNEIEGIRQLRKECKFWDVMALVEEFLGCFLVVPTFGFPVRKEDRRLLYLEAMIELGAGDNAPSFDIIWNELGNLKFDDKMDLEFLDDKSSLWLRFVEDADDQANNRVDDQYRELEAIKMELVRLEKEIHDLEAQISLKRRVEGEDSPGRDEDADLIPYPTPPFHRRTKAQIETWLEISRETLRLKRVDYCKQLREIRSGDFWNIVAGAVAFLLIGTHALGICYAASAGDIATFYYKEMKASVPQSEDLPTFADALKNAKRFQSFDLTIEEKEDGTFVWMGVPEALPAYNAAYQARCKVLQAEKSVSWFTRELNLRSNT